MIKYFSIDQTPVDEFDEWVAVLNLASMWFFKEVRSLLVTRIFCALITYKYCPRSEQEPLLDFQNSLNRRN